MINTSFFNLHCFVTLAQQLNYTKAAETLNLSQSALSRIIRGLENELGYDLFFRNTRSVRLTDAGMLFFTKIKKYLFEISLLVKEGEEVSKGATGILRVGFSPYTYSKIMPEIVARYRDKYPEVQLNLMTGEEMDIEAALNTGEIDLALVSDWSTIYPDEFEKYIIYEDCYCAVVSKDHPLAECSGITLENLRDEHILLVNFDYGFFPDNQNNINRPLEWCMTQGFLPNVSYMTTIKTLSGLPFMIACGSGVGFMAKHLEDFFSDTKEVIRFIKINDIEFKFSAIATHLKTNTNECIKDFVSIVQECAEKYR